jgi:hypothetical protein
MGIDCACMCSYTLLVGRIQFLLYQTRHPWHTIRIPESRNENDSAEEDDDDDDEEEGFD